MSGYPHGNTPPPGYGYGYGPPPGQGYGAQQGHPPPGQPYGAQQGHPPPGQAYGAQHGPPPGQPYAHQYGGYNAGHGAYNTSPQPGGGHGAYDTSPQHGAGHSPYSSSPYGASSAPYKPDKPSQSHYGASAPPVADPYGAHPPPSSHQPPHSAHSTPYGAPAPYGSPFAALVPSAFPPGTDQNIIACFQAADQDGSGLIDDMELQRALSMSNESFSLRTVHLLMYLFTNTNSRKIGPKEFTSVFYCLQNWRSIFERFDKDRSGKIDSIELRDALLSLGYAVSPVVLDLLVLKFDKTGGKAKAIEYDNFVECCLTVKGLTDKFKAKDTTYSGTATFSYEDFMLTVLPFLIA